MSEAYFCLVTWPDGTEGLLFPRPGNVPINTTLEDGVKDFNKAVADLEQFVAFNPKFAGTSIRLTRFERREVVKVFQPAPESDLTDKQVESVIENMYACPRCRRQMTHTHKHGYICEYCAGIED